MEIFRKYHLELISLTRSLTSTVQHFQQALSWPAASNGLIGHY